MGVFRLPHDTMTAELPNLMQVRAFVGVAESGSASRAALPLFRAQSAVTRAVAELERRLGAALFERRASGMRLTPEGQALLPRAHRVMGELANAARITGRTAEPMHLFQSRRLSLFVALCQTHHMQTVASLFGLSQPAVSAAIKMLEDGCGKPLFERTPRGLLPTALGREVVFPIRRALAELQRLDDDLAAYRQHLQGVVRVGALPLGRTRILPAAVVRLLRDHPAVQVTTVESPFEALATELRAGGVDFILGALRPPDYSSDLHREVLFEEAMVVVGRSAHPLRQSGCAPLMARDLADARWVLPRAGSPARRVLQRLFVANGLPAPVPQVETGDMAMIHGLLMQSDMLAVVSAHQLSFVLAREELAILPWPLPGSEREIGLTMRAGGLHAPASVALMAAIRAVVAEGATAS